MASKTGQPPEGPVDGTEPGMPGNPVELTDPRMMRALAHPARIAIWMHLGLNGPATATECAEIAGLSPSACSYHLRTLAVPPAVPRGAHWRLVGAHHDGDPQWAAYLREPSAA